MAEDRLPLEKKFDILESRLKKSFRAIKADIETLKQGEGKITHVDYKVKKSIDAFKNATYAAIKELREQIQSQQGQEMMTMLNEVRTETVTKQQIQKIRQELHDKIDILESSDLNQKEVELIRKDIADVADLVTKKQMQWKAELEARIAKLEKPMIQEEKPSIFKRLRSRTKKDNNKE